MKVDKLLWDLNASLTAEEVRQIVVLAGFEIELSAEEERNIRSLFTLYDDVVKARALGRDSQEAAFYRKLLMNGVVTFIRTCRK